MTARLAALAGTAAVAGMQACWLGGVFWLVDRRFCGGLLPVAWVLAGALPAFGLGRAARRLNRGRLLVLLLAAWGLWAGALLKVFFFPEAPLFDRSWVIAAARGAASPPASSAAILALIATTAAAFAAGARLASGPGAAGRVLGEFQFGLPVLGLVFFCAAQWGLAPPAPGGWVLAFFAFFLCGAAATRGRAASGWLQSLSRPQWLALFLGHALLVLAAGTTLAYAVTPCLLQQLLALLGMLWDAMVALVVAALAWLARLLPQPQIATPPAAPGGMATPAEGTGLPDLLRLPDYIRTIAQAVVGALWVGLLGVALWRLANQVAAWLRRQQGRSADATVEAMPGALRADLLRLLRWCLAWVADVGFLKRFLPAARGPGGPLSGADAARRTYRWLLAWSARQGRRRQPQQTPREFLADLCERFPPACSDMRRITEHYEQVRYGGVDPSIEALGELDDCRQRVRSAARHKKDGPRGRKGL
ncbi:MAG: DUF4129 domain-containing protein [Desulfobacterales bacterium]|jgi:hypothetical protein|nr:DUF4129 domain-containing protein [Desulfobacterales bacterium]